MKPLHRLVLVVATLLLAAVGATPAMSATIVQVFDSGSPGRFPDEIVINGDAHANRIVVHWNPKRRALIVQDTESVESERCDRLAANRVSCPFDHDELTINAERGRDSIIVRRETTRFDTIFIDGGPGSDHILGGDGHDFIEGGFGNDRLRGRGAYDFLNGDGIFTSGKGGDDVVRGGAGGDVISDSDDRGSDSLYGEAGRDLIDARDGLVDRVIDGGPGKDECTLDSKDPKPVSC